MLCTFNVHTWMYVQDLLDVAKDLQRADVGPVRRKWLDPVHGRLQHCQGECMQVVRL